MIAEETSDTKTNTHFEREAFLQNIFKFTEEHTNLKALYTNSVNTMKCLKVKVQILENVISKFDESDSQNSKIIQLQETIINYMKTRGNYEDLKTTIENLQQKIKNLETELREREQIYKNEHQSLIAKTKKQLEDTREHIIKVGKDKLDRMQKQYDELARKNDELKATLESMELETGEIIARLELEHKEEIFVLKSENQMLREKLQREEELHKQKIKMLEDENKEKSNCIQAIYNQRKKRNFSAMQTLDEAFALGGLGRVEESTRSKRQAEQSISNNGTADRRFTPCITDEKFMQ